MTVTGPLQAFMALKQWHVKALLDIQKTTCGQPLRGARLHDSIGPVLVQCVGCRQELGDPREASDPRVWFDNVVHATSPALRVTLFRGAAQTTRETVTRCEGDDMISGRGLPCAGHVTCLACLGAGGRP